MQMSSTCDAEISTAQQAQKRVVDNVGTNRAKEKPDVRLHNIQVIHPRVWESADMGVGQSDTRKSPCAVPIPISWFCNRCGEYYPSDH